MASLTIQDLTKVLKMFAADDARDDAHIESYFVKTGYFRGLLQDVSYVVTGHYGSGKTAFIRKLVRERTAGTRVQLIPISLRVDLFGEELGTANTKNEYATFAQALVYLHTLYRLAESASGTLVAGDKAALINELGALNLQPYGDLISRLAGAIGQAVGKVKKLDIAKVFNIELRDSVAAAIDMARYRQMCLKIQPLVNEQFDSREMLVIIDEVDAPVRLAKQTAALVGVLIRWLKEVERTTKVRFLIALPTNLLQVGRESAEIYTPSQELLAEVNWTPLELEQLVLDRVRAALGTKISPQDWLCDACGLKITGLHDFTFGRPRNYIQLVRSCLNAKLADPSLSPEKCREIGLQNYARQTLGWLQAEWQAVSDGFKDLMELLYYVDKSITQDKLKKGIDDVRQRGILKRRGIEGIIHDLAKWRLIKRIKGANRLEYTPHPIIKLAGQLD
jgi:hypothetical protein